MAPAFPFPSFDLAAARLSQQVDLLSNLGFNSRTCVCNRLLNQIRGTRFEYCSRTAASRRSVWPEKGAILDAVRYVELETLGQVEFRECN